MSRQQRIMHFALDHLRAVARQEWPLGVLALIGVAPGVATLLAWINLAFILREQQSTLLLGWLLPAPLLDHLGAEGVLVGAGVVTLLIGCLGLTNAYLASLARRTPALRLLRTLGLRRHELLWLLTMEALAIGLVGGGVGVLLGLGVSWVTWGEAALYLALPVAYQLSPLAVVIAVGIGLLAVLLFFQTAARLAPLDPTPQSNPTAPVNPSPQSGRAQTTLIDNGGGIQHAANQLFVRNSWIGTLYGALITFIVGLVVLPFTATLILTGLAGMVAILLNGGGWLLTHFYRRLPLSSHHPLWTLAIQGLARHPNHTAGMTLAMVTGAYAVGMAALSWLASDGFARFPFWVAGLVLLAGATLVFTVAALAVLERQTELVMLRALGARRKRLWQLVGLEYGIVALGGGSVGAVMALGNWVLAGQYDYWLMALGLTLADLLGALLSAWIGAAPVLWHLVRRQQV
jgi:predicted lysophospholipase L1 biosynthesis ABC-type transport system permease subunit